MVVVDVVDVPVPVVVVVVAGEQLFVSSDQPVVVLQIHLHVPEQVGVTGPSGWLVVVVVVVLLFADWQQYPSARTTRFSVLICWT